MDGRSLQLPVVVFWLLLQPRRPDCRCGKSVANAGQNLYCRLYRNLTNCKLLTQTQEKGEVSKEGLCCNFFFWLFVAFINWQGRTYK